jgi:hypothetical protein
MKTSIGLFTIILLFGCKEPMAEKTNFYVPDNIVYYQGLQIKDTSDQELLKGLYYQIFQREGKWVGLQSVWNQPTTRLRPYPSDSVFCVIEQKINYVENGRNKLLVRLGDIHKSEETVFMNKTRSGYEYFFLEQDINGYVIKKTWYNWQCYNESSGVIYTRNKNEIILRETMHYTKEVGYLCSRFISINNYLMQLLTDSLGKADTTAHEILGVHAYRQKFMYFHG